MLIFRCIEYTGCDFKSVCENHKRELDIRGIDSTNIIYIPNRVGTYTWTLFELMKNNKYFDIVYLDGHHTIYVDLPAFILADYLLKPGEVFLVDDIEWILSFLRNNMEKRFSYWYFYHKMYNFSDYTIVQYNMSHVKMIVKDILVNKLCIKNGSHIQISGGELL